MSNSLTHSIGKLSFHLKGVETEKVFAIRQQAASFLQHDFEHLAVEVFNEFALNDELLFIQQLNIDLQLKSSSFDFKKEESHLRDQIKEQITVQLQLYLETNLARGNAHDNGTMLPDSNLLLKAWAFYLEHGYLPSYIPLSLWLERLRWWKKAFIETNPQIKEFIILQLADEQRLKRFLKHTGTDEQQWIFDQLHPKLNSFLLHGKLQFNRDVAFSYFEIKTYLLFLFSESNHELLQNEEQLPAIDWVMHHSEAYHQTGSESLIDSKKTVDTKNSFVQKTNEVIIIPNAGIVLLQPFISTLFNELHLLSEDRKALLDKEQACALLSFLAGDEEQSEIHYPLYKLICGLQLHEFVDANVQLTIEQKEECSHLLQQVIVHWPALKQSSVPSMQQTFLQRTGKLSKKEDKWLLQVEQLTEDVLIHYLPWSYSIIRYPWMKQVLFTEWT